MPNSSPTTSSGPTATFIIREQTLSAEIRLHEPVNVGCLLSEMMARGDFLEAVHTQLYVVGDALIDFCAAAVGIWTGA
ncbi:hypothetical protein ARSEF1564_001232 [Beauveria bassiana]